MTHFADVIPEYARHPDNRKLDNIPGSFGTPLIGDTFRFLPRPFEVLDEKYKRYGPISKASMTFQKMIVALGPEYIKRLTLDLDQEFSTRMGYDAPLGDFFDGGLLMRDFDAHKFHRRIMQTAFKTAAMRTYIDQMHPLVETATANWAQDPKFHFYPHIKTLLLDIGAKVFLGLELEGDETRKLNQAFLAMGEGSLALIRKDWPGLGLAYRKGMNGRRYLEDYFLKLVPTRRGVTGGDMATYFANETTDEGELFADDIVAKHLIFLLLAAHDTTTSTLSMAASLLAHHQDWQERLREQIRSLGHNRLSYDDLERVTDIENTFKETLRLHPAVPMLMRRTVRDIDLDGYRVPAHTMIQVSPLYTHRMEQWWDRPHDFDPDRFAREEHKRHAFQWAPFGGGAHKCIGLHFADMLFKCVLSSLLQNYRIDFPAGRPYPAPVQHFPFAKPMDGLPLVLTRLT